jgi:hypothetical protein
VLNYLDVAQGRAAPGQSLLKEQPKKAPKGGCRRARRHRAFAQEEGGAPAEKASQATGKCNFGARVGRSAALSPNAASNPAHPRPAGAALRGAEVVHKALSFPNEPLTSRTQAAGLSFSRPKINFVRAVI